VVAADGQGAASPRTVSAATAGSVNAVTRERYLDDGYKSATVRHSTKAVLRSFYDYWIEVELDTVELRRPPHSGLTEPR
jgi:hypothetical protein